MRQRIVLSVLALNANRVTSVHTLAEALWDDDPPVTARAQIQTCVSSLRKLFADAGLAGAIVTRPPGYLLEISAADLDSEAFTGLVTAARGQAEQGRLGQAAATLRDALALWRGPALADVDSDLVRRAAARFEDSRLAAIEERVRLDLALGRHEAIVGELATLVAEHPLCEQLAGYRMLALYRSGRQADALEVGRRTRARLVELAGIEPGPELQRLQHAILTRDPALDLQVTEAETVRAETVRAEPPAGNGAGSGSGGGDGRRADELAVIPRQLPASIADFTGRDADIAEIKRILGGDHKPARDGYAVRIVAISGKGGVGKSSLATRVAHELSADFPDGLLYGDLQNLDGEDAIARLQARFLRALGVSGQAIPDDEVERVELYRSLLAHKRILVVLDDVASEEQVRMLLPGSPTCAVITTSRMRLSGLSGAHWVDLDVFNAEQSMELLAKIIGPARVRAEREHAAELVLLCGGLPLALRIAGARLAARPHWSIQGLVRRLSDEANRLDELTYRGLELRFNIDVTYRGLSQLAKRLFRLFAVIRTPDFADWMAAVLLDTDLDEAAEVLEGLIDARLLDTVEYPGERVRYRLHSLIRVYAMERLMQNEDLAERDEVLRRVLSATLALAELAHREEYGGDYTVLHGRAPRWQPPRGWAGTLPAKPMDWWNAEHRWLVAAVREAAAAGLDELCWDLALTLVTMFEAKGCFDDWQETARLGLEVTERAGNRVGQAAMLYSLGTLNMFRKRLTEAHCYLTSALDIFRADGNTHGCALVLRNGAIVDGLVGDFRAMVHKYGEALELMRTVGDHMGEAQILRSLAMFWIDEGDADLAREMLEEALAICRRVNCRRGEAQVLHRFAYLHMHNGEIDLAVREFERVVRIVRNIGDRIGEVYALYGLGVGRCRQGKLSEGETDLLEALGYARMMGERLIEGQALHALGEIGLAKGEGAAGAAYLAEACRVFEELGSTLWLAKSMTLLSRHHADIGAVTEASQEAARARGLLSKVDSKEAARWLSTLDEPRSAPPSDDSVRPRADLRFA